MDKEKAPIINIDSKKTLWILINSTSFDDLGRHISDTIYSIYHLKKSGVPEASIKVYTNSSFVGSHDASFADHNISIKSQDISVFNSDLASLKGFENCFIIVGGHGSHLGIHVKKKEFLKPFDVLSSLKSIKDLKYGALILCQCYAGIFNYLDAEGSPELFLMAGTNLKLSLSLQVDLEQELKSVSGNGDLKSWPANPFQFYFSEWIANPVDIDGDGLNSFLDAYRYASSKTNEKTIGIKGEMFTFYGDRLKFYRELQKQKESRALSTEELAQVSSSEAFLLSAPQNLFNVESPWLLNPRFGRRLIFK